MSIGSRSGEDERAMRLC